MGDLVKLKSLIFETDNNACFIERDRILGRIEKELKGYNGADKYAIMPSGVLTNICCLFTKKPLKTANQRLR